MYKYRVVCVFSEQFFSNAHFVQQIIEFDGTFFMIKTENHQTRFTTLVVCFIYSGMTCWLIGALCHILFHSIWPFLPPKKKEEIISKMHLAKSCYSLPMTTGAQMHVSSSRCWILDPNDGLKLPKCKTPWKINGNDHWIGLQARPSLKDPNNWENH